MAIGSRLSRVNAVVSPIFVSNIRGMRITVYDLLSYLASGMTYEQVLADFPYLTKEDILACLSYDLA